MQTPVNPEKDRPLEHNPVVPRSMLVNLAVEFVSGGVLFYVHKRRIVMDVLETVFLAVVLFLGINSISARIRVDSVSMQNTLFAGDFVLVNKLAYKLGEPHRGDIIVFRYPPNPQEIPYIKRVIGLPGDQVQIADGQVFINGQGLIEPYLKNDTPRDGTWNVPEDSLFVMGDNRHNSSDSRMWGFVPIENVIGKALVIYLPFDHWSLLDVSSAFAAVPAPTLPTVTPTPSGYPVPESPSGGYPLP